VWSECSNSGVDTASTNGYSGYIWAIITEDTTPSLDDLQGTPFSGYGATVGYCFIATAAYGMPVAEEIQILREFRDEYLVTSPMGRVLVDFYYRVSPPVAQFITEHPGLKPVVRAGLLPVVAISSIAVNTTLAEKLVIIGLLALVSAALAVWTMRRWGQKPRV
jgi:hypothetical protein